MTGAEERWKKLFTPNTLTTKGLISALNHARDVSGNQVKAGEFTEDARHALCPQNHGINDKKLKMIITKAKPYSWIKKQLKKTDKIGIVGCNSCARMCHTGGKEEMEKLAAKLKKDLFDVVDMDLIGIACDMDQLKREELKGDVTIVLSCDAGVYNLKKLFPKRKIIPALETVGLAAWDEKGNLTLVREFK